VIYRITTATEGSDDPGRVIQDASKIVGRTGRTGETMTFTDNSTQSPSYYTYIVTALSATHFESEPAVAE
jgi:hypothetical protein